MISEPFRGAPMKYFDKSSVLFASNGTFEDHSSHNYSESNCFRFANPAEVVGAQRVRDRAAYRLRIETLEHQEKLKTEN